MKTPDYKKWAAETEKHNAALDYGIAVGARVLDIYGNEGTVSQISLPGGPLTPSDHGGITIKLEKADGGPVNPDYPEEHYVVYEWYRWLKVLEAAPYETT